MSSYQSNATGGAAGGQGRLAQVIAARGGTVRASSLTPDDASNIGQWILTLAETNEKAVA